MQKKQLKLLVRKLVSEAVSTESRPVSSSRIDEALNKVIEDESLYVKISRRPSRIILIELIRKNVDNESAVSFIELSQGTDSPCLGAWMIKMAFSREKGYSWGRLLYHIAMEKLGKIMPDRDFVSDDAKKIWDEFFNGQEVSRWQLDDIVNTLTPEEDDNCQLAFPGNPLEDYEDEWYNKKDLNKKKTRTKFLQSPLSGAYGKESQDIIKKLKENNKLVDESGF